MEPNLTADVQSCSDRLTESLTVYTRQYPALRLYSFSYENGQWTAVPKVRLRHAARMLLESECSCEQAGLDCGVSSYGYFKRVFERGYGVSPREYRAEMRAKDTK